MRTPLAALLAVALVAGAVVAAVVVATGRSGSSSSSPCAQSWASATSGRPELVSDKIPAGVFLWRSGESWHVTLRGAPVPLIGRVSSDGPLRVGGGPASALDPALSATSRDVSFRSPSSGNGSLVFHANCGSRLAFSFAGTAQPSVFLGRARHPVSPRFLLGRSETTGVSGQLYSSGGCPTLTIGQSCPSAKPLHQATQIQVLTAVQSKTSGKQPELVKTITSAGDGSYTASLSAGRYLLQGAGTATGGASFTPVDVTVAPDVMTVVDLPVDSGIR